MLDTVLSFVCDLGRGIERTAIRPALLTGDDQAHTFRIAVSRSGQAVSLSGAGVSGYFIRADGVTVPITGSVEGSAALVTLSDGCYRVPGRFQLVVKLSLSGETSTVFWGDGAVASSSTDAILDDEDVIPSLDELLAKIAATEAAAASATSAAATASGAASTADTAASRANTAAASVEGMSAKATTLSPGSQATASMATVDGAKVLTIGVPQGVKGDKGDKGDPGDVSSVNGVAPVQGNVTLTASDVGALEADGTAANAAMLGGKAPEYYLQPRNLLDNSDFTNPVNQRGASSYSGLLYSIDRWRGIGQSVTVTLGGGITVTSNNGNQYGQYLSDEAWNRLKGKPFTFALCTSDGAVHIATGTMTSGSELYDSPQTTIGSTAFKMNLYKDPNARPMVRIFALSESTITILWAALYEGSYTADTLPPYVPKGYAAELLECMRYYRTLNVLFGTEIGSATRQLINYTPAMRISPTSSAAVTSGSSSTASATINVATDRYIDISTNSWGNALVTLSADL